MPRHELTDREWAFVEPLLPKRRTGRPPKDHRMIINALLWLGKTGAPWRDLPERLVGRLKEDRRLATRHDKLAANYLALVHLAALRIRL